MNCLLMRSTLDGNLYSAFSGHNLITEVCVTDSVVFTKQISNHEKLEVLERLIDLEKSLRSILRRKYYYLRSVERSDRRTKFYPLACSKRREKVGVKHEIGELLRAVLRRSVKKSSDGISLRSRKFYPFMISKLRCSKRREKLYQSCVIGLK